MKTFNQYVNEETLPFAQTDKGLVGVEDPAVRDNINNLLDGVTTKGFITPYIGLERVSKVLANFHIFLPKYTFAGGDEGVTAFEINQFGPKIGMTNDGQVVEKESSPYYLYFEYRAGDDGMFGVFASVVTEDELDELMSDYEDEEEDDDTEEMNEEKMTDAEMKEREKIVKSMKNNMADFKKRYGKDAESVMYATATKQAMKAVEEATFPGAPSVKMPMKTSKHEKMYNDHHSELKSLADGGEINTPAGKKRASGLIDKIQGLVDKHLPGSPVPSKKIWLGEKSLEEENAPFEGAKKKSTPNPESRARQLAKMAAKSAKKKAIKKVKGESGKEMYHAKVAATEETQIDEALPLQYFALSGQRADQRAKKRPDMSKPFDKVVSNAIKSAKKKQKSKIAKEETRIDEGRPSQRHPLEGHEYHKKSNAELLYIAKDAHKAAKAMKGHNTEAENKYLDQANDSATVRHFRERNGMPNWYKKKYGHDTK